MLCQSFGRFLLLVSGFIAVQVDQGSEAETLLRVDAFCEKSHQRSGFCVNFVRQRSVRQSRADALGAKKPATVPADEVAALISSDVVLANSTADLGVGVVQNKSIPPAAIQTKPLPEASIVEEHEIAEVPPSKDDPACGKLRGEYDAVCFATPPVAAFEETRIFCDAFVENCRHSLVTNIFTTWRNIKINFGQYCKKQRERFRYVCPNPLRFNSFSNEAVDFCIRYQERCPLEKVPAAPVPFKSKYENHIYLRELEFWCFRTRRTAFNYCTEPDLLSVPKYAFFCGFYKYQCIDSITKRVIYG